MAELLEVTFAVPAEPGGLLWSWLCPALWVLSSSSILPLAGKKKKTIFKALFPWGKASVVRKVRAEMSSDPAAGSRLPGVLRRPLPVSQSCRRGASPAAAFGRSLPPSASPLPPASASASALQPSSPPELGAGGSGPAGGRAALLGDRGSGIGDGGSGRRFLPAASAQQPWRRTQPPCLL